MELLFNRPPTHTLTVEPGTPAEQKVAGGQTFTAEDSVGEQLLANPAYHCRIPGPEPAPSAPPAPRKPRGRRRIPDKAAAQDPIVAAAENPDAGSDVEATPDGDPAVDQTTELSDGTPEPGSQDSDPGTTD